MKWKDGYKKRKRSGKELERKYQKQNPELYIFEKERTKELQKEQAKEIKSYENKIIISDETYKTAINLAQDETNKKWEDKIKEKIEKLFKKLDETNNDRWEKNEEIYYNQIKSQIRVLKELLKEGE